MARPTDLEDTTAGFVDNLWKIVNNDEYKEYISWNKDGTGVLINRSQKTYIENVILPRLGCKTRNFNSFIRNLNKYDFHRNKNPDEYTNPNFRKDEPELRKKIKLNKGPKKQRQQQQQTSNSSLTVMQLAPTVNDTANSPVVAVPSNHPAAFPATSSTSGALLQHSAVLQNVNSPQPSQLVHPQFTITSQSATQQETFQSQVQSSSSKLLTKQVQQWPMFNPQLIGNNSQEGSPMQLVTPLLVYSNLDGQFYLTQQFQQQAAEILGVGAQQPQVQQQQQQPGSFPQVEHFAPAVVQPVNPLQLSAVPSTQNTLLPENRSTSVAALPTSGGAAEGCSPQPANLFHPQFTTAWQSASGPMQTHPLVAQLLYYLSQGGNPMQLVTAPLPHVNMYGQFHLPQQQAVEGAWVDSQQLQLQQQQQQQQMSGSFPQVEHFARTVGQPTNPLQLSAVPSTQNSLLPESTSTSVAALLTSGGAGECSSSQPVKVSRKRKAEEELHRGAIDSGLESEGNDFGPTGQELDEQETQTTKIDPNFGLLKLQQQQQQQPGWFPQVEHFAPTAVQQANPPLSTAPSTHNALLPESTSTSVAALLTNRGAAESCSPQPAKLVSRKRRAGNDFGPTGQKLDGQETQTTKIDPNFGLLKGGGLFALKNVQVSDSPHLIVGFGGKEVKVVKEADGNDWLGKTPPGDILGKVQVIIMTPKRKEVAWTEYTYCKDSFDEFLTSCVSNEDNFEDYCDNMGKCQCESQESGMNFTSNTGILGLPTQGEQLHSVDVLRRMLYTAARIGAEKFIRTVFRTSAGRIVFEEYKMLSALPEDIADANGHDEVAAYFQGITERFSKQEGPMQSKDINWRELARAIKEGDEKYCLTETKPTDDDTSDTEYFADTEASSPASDNGSSDSYEKGRKCLKDQHVMCTHHFSENEVQLLRKGDNSRPMDAENSTENSLTDLENAKSGSEDLFQEKCSQGSISLSCKGINKQPEDKFCSLPELQENTQEEKIPGGWTEDTTFSFGEKSEKLPESKELLRNQFCDGGDDDFCASSPELPETTEDEKISEKWSHGTKIKENREGSSGGGNGKPPQLRFKFPKASNLPKTWIDWSKVELPIDVLLLTVKDCEFLSCYFYLDEAFKTYHEDIGPVYFGATGNDDREKLKIALIKCSSGAFSYVTNALRVLRPKAVFSVGTCHGLISENIKIGDILAYSKLRTPDFRTPVNRNFGNLIRHSSYGWKAPLENPDEWQVQVHCDADVLSEEGEGIFAAAFDSQIEWVIVKGISDYADGAKGTAESWSNFASVMAASVAAHILSDPFVFRSWPNYGGSISSSCKGINKQPEDKFLSWSELQEGTQEEKIPGRWTDDAISSFDEKSEKLPEFKELSRNQFCDGVDDDFCDLPETNEECQRNTTLESTVNIYPKIGPVEGGLCFELYFVEKLPESMNYGWALFGDNQPVKVWKTSRDCLYGDKIPPATGPGSIVVTVLTQSNSYLGETLFTYFDEEKKKLIERLVGRDELQQEFFEEVCNQFGSDEKRRKQDKENSESSKYGVQQNSVSLLRRLVYTAARIGAEDFIRMLFSSSAGRLVFKTYKNNSPLPEEIATSNAHYEVAAYLQAITERFSKESETSQTSNEMFWLELIIAAEDSDLKTGALEKSRGQMAEDNSDRDDGYFSDTEISSSVSEKERFISEVAGFPIQRSQAAYHQIREAERVGPDCHTPASNKQAKDEVVERDLQNSTARVCKGEDTVKVYFSPRSDPFKFNYY